MLELKATLHTSFSDLVLAPVQLLDIIKDGQPICRANVCISDPEDLYDPRKKAVAVYGDRGSCSPASRCKCNEYVGDVLLHGIVLGPEPEPLAASSSKLGWGCSGGPTIPIRLVLGNSPWSLSVAGRVAGQ